MSTYLMENPVTADDPGDWQINLFHICKATISEGAIYIFAFSWILPNRTFCYYFSWLGDLSPFMVLFVVNVRSTPGPEK